MGGVYCFCSLVLLLLLSVLRGWEQCQFSNEAYYESCCLCSFYNAKLGKINRKIVLCLSLFPYFSGVYKVLPMLRPRSSVCPLKELHHSLPANREESVTKKESRSLYYRVPRSAVKRMRGERMTLTAAAEREAAGRELMLCSPASP